MDRLINIIMGISEIYKELLREKGHDVDNVPFTKISFGCEKYKNIPIKPSSNN